VRDQHALLLAAGQFPNSLVCELDCIDCLEHLRDDCRTCARRQRKAQPVAVKTKRNQIQRPQREKRVERNLLRYVTYRAQPSGPVDPDSTRSRCLETKNGAQQRRLAGAIGTDQPAELG
jgi:hypothetical protein